MLHSRERGGILCFDCKEEGRESVVRLLYGWEAVYVLIEHLVVVLFIRSLLTCRFFFPYLAYFTFRNICNFEI